MKKKISPSILSVDPSNLERAIKLVEQHVDMLHIDAMDGQFVPPVNMEVPAVEALRKTTDLEFDTHLMIEKPENFVEAFSNAGSHILTVHAETISDDSIFDQIHDLGKKAGVAINPDKEISMIEPYLDKVEMVLPMSVFPGFGGQEYIDVTEKIKQLREIYDKDIQVDGGIKLSNIKEVADAGANVFVSGSGIFNTDDPVATIKKMRELIE